MSTLRSKLIRIARQREDLRVPIARAIRAGDRQAAGKPWSKLPKGWTDKSVKKMWDTLTGDAKHKVTKCMKDMEGKVDDTGAFCGSLADKATGSTKWRGKDKKAKENYPWAQCIKDKKKDPNVDNPEAVCGKIKAESQGLGKSKRSNQEINVSNSKKAALLRLAQHRPDLLWRSPKVARTIRRMINAGELPEAFKKNIEKMKAKSKAKGDDKAKDESKDDKFQDFLKSKGKSKGKKKAAWDDWVPQEVKDLHNRDFHEWEPDPNSAAARAELDAKMQALMREREEWSDQQSKSFKMLRRVLEAEAKRVGWKVTSAGYTGVEFDAGLTRGQERDRAALAAVRKLGRQVAKKAVKKVPNWIVPREKSYFDTMRLNVPLEYTVPSPYKRRASQKKAISLSSQDTQDWLASFQRAAIGLRAGGALLSWDDTTNAQVDRWLKALSKGNFRMDQWGNTPVSWRLGRSSYKGTIQWDNGNTWLKMSDGAVLFDPAQAVKAIITDAANKMSGGGAGRGTSGPRVIRRRRGRPPVSVMASRRGTPLLRVAARYILRRRRWVQPGSLREAARGKTFREAREDIFDYLRSKGWDVKDRLKVPHATSPYGDTRVWFKAQAVYHAHDKGGRGPLKFNQAHSMWVDIRTLDGPAFLRQVESWNKTKEGGL